MEPKPLLCQLLEIWCQFICFLLIKMFVTMNSMELAAQPYNRILCRQQKITALLVAKPLIRPVTALKNMLVLLSLFLTQSWVLEPLRLTTTQVHGVAGLWWQTELKAAGEFTSITSGVVSSTCALLMRLTTVKLSSKLIALTRRLPCPPKTSILLIFRCQVRWFVSLLNTDKTTLLRMFNSGTSMRMDKSRPLLGLRRRVDLISLVNLIALPLVATWWV